MINRLYLKKNSSKFKTRTKKINSYVYTKNYTYLHFSVIVSFVFISIIHFYSFVSGKYHITIEPFATLMLPKRRPTLKVQRPVLLFHDSESTYNRKGLIFHFMSEKAFNCVVNTACSDLIQGTTLMQRLMAKHDLRKNYHIA